MVHRLVASSPQSNDCGSATERDVAQVPRLCVQRPIEISYVPEHQDPLSPPPTAQRMEKLGIHTSSVRIKRSSD